jgi:hypothetical protein
MKCAFGGEADIPATRFFVVQGQQAQGDRHLNAARKRFIPEKLLGLFERTTWAGRNRHCNSRGQPGPKLDISLPDAGDAAILNRSTASSRH